MPPKQQIMQETAQTHLVSALKMAEESKQIGVNTLVKLDEQTEQLRRVQADAQDTEHIITQNRGVVKDMKRHWIVRLCCYNRSDILPGDVEWDRRDSPEEQARVKKMIKLDKRRRRNRRMAKRVGASQQEIPDHPQDPKPSKWSWFRSSKGQLEVSDSSDYSSSEDESIPATKELPKTKKVHVPKVEIPQDIDEDTALDQLHNTVQDLKVIALQISETSKQHQVVLGGITEQVNTNQTHLDKNQALVGTLGRRARDDGDNGMLSAQDRLAIAGVKAAVTSRIN
jgi:hypothetical protein